MSNDRVLMESNVMLDPSLMTSASKLENTFNLMKKHAEDFEFYLPPSFIAHVISAEEQNESDVLRFFRDRAWYSTSRVLNEKLKENLDLYRVFEVSRDMREKHAGFWNSLRETAQRNGDYDEVILKIVFEEWVFLQEKSLIISRTKKAFEKFVDGGAIVAQASEDRFKNLVGLTVKLPVEELQRFDYLRAFGKWLAASGPPFVVLGVSPTWAAVLSSFTGWVLVIDP